MLHIVGTPIGNMEDFSLRGAKTLLAADIILAENTNSAGRLIEFAQSAYHLTKNPSQKVYSYHKDNEYAKMPEMIDLLTAGKDIALISEAGMPIISDPGLLLVKTCHKQNLKVAVIPGPTAVDSAVALCGIAHDTFHFLGFLPKKVSHKTALFAKLQDESKLHKHSVLFVAYESPMRINETLEILNSNYPSVSVVVCRELTKIYEEVLMNPKSLENAKGEIVMCFKFA